MSVNYEPKKSNSMKKLTISIFILSTGYSILSCSSESTKKSDTPAEETKIEEPKYGSFLEPKSQKTYRTVLFGSSEWMAENLDVSTFRNGDSIMEIGLEGKDYDKDWNAKWQMALKNKIPAYSYVIEYIDNGYGGPLKAREERKYGKIYNIYALLDPRGLAPEGWKVSTDIDWKNMTESLEREKKFDQRILWKRDVVKNICREKLNQNNNISFSGFDALPSQIILDYGSMEDKLSFWVMVSDTTTVADFGCSIDNNHLVRPVLTEEEKGTATSHMIVHHSSPVRCVKIK